MEHTFDPDDRRFQRIAVDVPGGVFRIEVLGVKPGLRKDWRELVVSELRVLGIAGAASRHVTLMPRVAVGSFDAPPPEAIAVLSDPTEENNASAPGAEGLCAGFVAREQPAIERVRKELDLGKRFGPTPELGCEVKELFAKDRASAGAFALYVETALRWQLHLGARFDRARIRPLHDQRHAYNTFHYTHRQDSRHELALDRAREGTSLPDLLGLRVLETSLIARVRAHLPRIRRDDLVEKFPSGEAFEHASFDERGPMGLEVLAEAAAAALALPDLRGRSVDVRRARRAVVHVAGPDVSSRLLGDFLGLRVRAVQSLRTLPVEPALIRAVEKQAMLQAALAVKDGS